jgi:cell wall-associated NlpC family hydrolase
LAARNGPSLDSGEWGGKVPGAVSRAFHASGNAVDNRGERSENTAMRRAIIGPAVAVALAAVGALWASPAESEARKAIVETAQSFEGVPYVYGAESPQAFDCSGFVQYVYAHAADIDIPRNSKGQWAAGTPIDKTAVKPGDIFVFDTVGGGGPSHVAIYLGGDSMIHAVSEGPRTGVLVSSTSDRYFGPRMIGARYFIVPAFPSAAAPKPAAAPPPVASAKSPTQAAPAAPAKAAVAPQPAPVPAEPEPVVSQVGFVVKSAPEVFTDKIPAATGTAIAFTVTNGTGRNGVFHIFFYKASVDFSKIAILREDRQEIPAGGSVEIAPYLFTEPGIYRLNVKTADNTQLMQRTWKVLRLSR